MAVPHTQPYFALHPSAALRTFMIEMTNRFMFHLEDAPLDRMNLQVMFDVGFNHIPGEEPGWRLHRALWQKALTDFDTHPPDLDETDCLVELAEAIFS